MDFQIFDHIPIGLAILKRDRKALTCLYANTALKNMLGWQLEGKALESIWPCEETNDLARKLKGPTPPSEATLPFLRDGKPSWALLTISQERYDSEDCYALWATDISASKDAEESLKLAVSHADALADQKSNFLATISHEIRTPMQSVYGLLEMIELEKPSPNILSMAMTARNSASGLLEILDDVLDFAKMDADQMELDHFEVPVRTLARGILEAMAVKVQGKKIELKDDIAGDVPFVIVGDPKRLRQIIINLMGNAMKFTQEGSVTIKVSRGGQHLPEPARGFILRLEIVDTGIGMSDEVAAKLFRPFAQADNSTSRKYGGTGLGLSICKKLVEIMGGQIGVESRIGKGSTFWFEIPTEEVSTEANVLDLPVLDGISVLSVEDHPMGAKEIVKSLRSMGATVESCPTYAEALDLVKRRPFDVGVIDQGLPDGLGLDLIREIMQIRPFMGLVMYTVRDDAGLQHSLQSLGVTYLSKPASRIGLGEAVRDAASKIQKLDVLGPRRLLIAEDTLSVRDVLSRQLVTLGVEATFVENGRDALFAVRSGEYGILLTDLHMPEIDGYEVIRSIRDDDRDLNRHFPVVALTADVQMAQRQVYMQYGFDECLLKPVSLGQFRRLLIRWGLLGESSPANTAAVVAKTEAGSAIDREAMIAQMGAFDENAVEMLGMFLEMTEPLIEEIKTASANNDQARLKEHAHSLKGAARSACLNDLGDAAATLQNEAENGDGNPTHVQKIVEEFARAKKEISAL
ncbi:MAG: hybrid sensor histidine kinase/response regulator [Micavibrio aeruginosavorus]|uniref:histidine kinase n=1 Tax=Micavibrio aeruginosavorus TaxID=349221 RepID=A0A2W5PY94_9BACT|nr:MAG: hybrid sensor histidine kinase/response regulator [Micavibrio aeruginosavorus]